MHVCAHTHRCMHTHEYAHTNVHVCDNGAYVCNVCCVQASAYMLHMCTQVPAHVSTCMHELCALHVCALYMHTHARMHVCTSVHINCSLKVQNEANEELK
jgi:hypothetical protein